MTRPNDWTEDFSHENGQYYNICYKCNQEFQGHKRRVICRVCNDPLMSAIRSLTAETLYEDGEMCKGISVKFICRLAMLKNAAGMLADGDPLVIDARKELGLHSTITAEWLARTLANQCDVEEPTIHTTQPKKVDTNE